MPPWKTVVFQSCRRNCSIELLSCCYFQGASSVLSPYKVRPLPLPYQQLNYWLMTHCSIDDCFLLSNGVFGKTTDNFIVTVFPMFLLCPPSVSFYLFYSAIEILFRFEQQDNYSVGTKNIILLSFTIVFCSLFYMVIIIWTILLFVGYNYWINMQWSIK